MKPIPEALATASAALFEERRRPDFRDVFGALARESDAVATAVTRVRLSTVDLSAEELAPLRSFLVLVAELSALRLDAEARGMRSDHDGWPARTSCWT